MQNRSHHPQKIGFFGGTFDPIHFGHLNLAIQIMEIHRLDQVWICPAYRSPHKKEDPAPVLEEHRLAMLALAISPLNRFKLLDVELNRPGPSYTIDTIRFLLQEAKQQGAVPHMHLILGEDALEGLSAWKEVEELVKLAPPLIGSRQAGQISSPIFHSPALEQVIQKGRTSISMMEISSTLVRKRLEKRLYCGHLVPDSVLEYIYKNKLYLEVN